MLAVPAGEWCNGNTAVFGTVILGSSPSSPATSPLPVDIARHDGGAGVGQVNLLYLNEILGRTDWGPVVFGCQGPDSGNSEILAAFGTPEQKARYLTPLVAGEVYSCFSMVMLLCTPTA